MRAEWPSRPHPPCPATSNGCPGPAAPRLCASTRRAEPPVLILRDAGGEERASKPVPGPHTEYAIPGELDWDAAWLHWPDGTRADDPAPARPAGRGDRAAPAALPPVRRGRTPAGRAARDAPPARDAPSTRRAGRGARHPPRGRDGHTGRAGRGARHGRRVGRGARPAAPARARQPAAAPVDAAARTPACAAHGAPAAPHGTPAAPHGTPAAPHGAPAAPHETPAARTGHCGRRFAGGPRLAIRRRPSARDARATPDSPAAHASSGRRGPADPPRLRPRARDDAARRGTRRAARGSRRRSSRQVRSSRATGRSVRRRSSTSSRRPPRRSRGPARASARRATPCSPR